MASLEVLQPHQWQLSAAFCLVLNPSWCGPTVVWLISEYENCSKYGPSLLLHSPSDARSQALSYITIANINALRVLKFEKGAGQRDSEIFACHLEDGAESD